MIHFFLVSAVKKSHQTMISCLFILQYILAFCSTFSYLSSLCTKSQKFDNCYLIIQKIINLLQIPCLLQCSNLLLLNNVVKCGSCINFQTIWIKYWSWLRKRWRDPSQHPAENYLVISARKHGSSISELWTKTSFIIKQFLLEYGMDAENINFKENLCIQISKIFLPHLFVSKLINPRNFEISALLFSKQGMCRFWLLSWLGFGDSKSTWNQPPWHA